MPSRSPNTDRASWLSHHDYLAALHEQAVRLANAAGTAGAQARVPSCPGWTVLDLVQHVVQVYAHKAAVVRAGTAVDGSGIQAAAGLDLDRALTRHAEVISDLTELLGGLPPDTPTWTWMEGAGESTVGAWARRMAHEALIHRVDAELAADSDVSPAGEALAIDGINEALTWMAGDPDIVVSDEGRAGEPGTLLIDFGSGAYVVDLSGDQQTVSEAATTLDTDARIAGQPFAIDLALWGRPAAARYTGTSAVLQRLQARLAASTQ